MIIADTGFWLALANRKDTYHAEASTAFSLVEEPLVTTWPVVTETCYFLLKRMGNSGQANFINNLTDNAFEVYDLIPSQGKRINALMYQYADLPMDFADASLILLAEHLNHGKILSADRRDFMTYRWGNNKPFENLMFR